MYLPFESTFLRLLQLPLLLSSSDNPNPGSVVPDAPFGHHPSHRHEDLNDLGNISPYHDAPTVHGVSVDLPDDCTVDQVILLHRHGSRGPTRQPQAFIHELVATLDKARDIIQSAVLPPSFEFLKDGYEYQLVPEELTIVGRKELFDHGVEFGLRYPTFSTDVVVSTTVQRVIDSAHFFVQGLLGRGAENVTFLTTKDFDDPVSWLTPWSSCPKFPYNGSHEATEEWAKKYIPPIAARLNDRIPGVNFSSDDVRGALNACPYDLAAHNNSPWCNVFTALELRGLEYEFDLGLDVLTGHRGDPGPLAGAFYIKKVIERLTNVTEDAERLYLDFAHDFTILVALSTMGLNKDTVPLSPSHPNPDRKFRSSYQTPFAARMIWERFTCQTSFEGPQVRLVLNGATLPLSICEESTNDKTYGTCSLDNFVRANAFSTSAKYHSEIWNATCELSH